MYLRQIWQKCTDGCFSRRLTRFSAFWLVVRTMDDRQLPITNKHPGIWPNLLLLLMAEWVEDGKDEASSLTIDFILSLKLFLVIKIHGKPMDSKNLKYILLLFCAVLDYGQLRDSPAVGKFFVQVRAPLGVIDQRFENTLQSVRNRLILFLLHPLDCSSGADCGVGEYCDRRKYKRDWRNNCRRGFSSAHCLIEFTVDLSLDLRSCYPSV